MAGLGVGLAVRLRAVAELSAAEQALLRDDPAAARAHLDRYLTRRPDDERALFLSAQAARRSDACGDAERFLTAAEAKSGPTGPTRFEWALLGVQQADFTEEERLRALVLRNHPDSAAILEALAKGYNAAFRWPESAEALDRLLARNANHVPALLLRGAVLERMRQVPAAEQDFRRAASLAPESAAANAALAGHLYRTGHAREAVAHYERALWLRPGDLAALLGLARTLADSADLAGAQRRLDELLAIDPNHVEGLVERGRVALRQRKADEALVSLDRAVAAAPWHRDAHALRLLALKDLGKAEDAARCEARVAELQAEDATGGRLKVRARDNRDDTATRWELWLWSLRNGEADEGVAWLTEILRAAPRHAQARAAFADYFDRSGQPRRAALYRSPAEP